MKIKVKYFNKDVMPIETIQKGSWVDLRAAEDVFMQKGEFKLIPLGVAIKLPIGYEAIVAPRSSTFKKYGLIQTNSIGVIDGIKTDESGNIIEGTGYCGDNDQWFLPVYATRDIDIKMNERICQFRIFESQPVLEIETVEHLANVDRGGFGSTGRI